MRCARWWRLIWLAAGAGVPATLLAWGVGGAGLDPRAPRTREADPVRGGRSGAAGSGGTRRARHRSLPARSAADLRGNILKLVVGEDVIACIWVHLAVQISGSGVEWGLLLVGVQSGRTWHLARDGILIPALSRLVVYYRLICSHPCLLSASSPEYTGSLGWLAGCRKTNLYINVLLSSTR